MRARLLPLERKYYGTRVAIVDDDGFEQVVSIWRMGGAPSDRELKPYTRADWDANIDIPGGWAGELMPIQSEGIDWSHFESDKSLDMAVRLVDAINRGSE